ncbi:hypothetical protein WMF38_13580 [Sorangium sp. So ce118]
MLASPPNDSSQTIILTGELAHLMRNNIGFPSKNSNMGGVDPEFNTWDLDITETSSAFESTSDDGCTGPREADGRVPSACVFMKFKTDSPLIDKGTDVGLPFVGTAPELRGGLRLLRHFRRRRRRYRRVRVSRACLRVRRALPRSEDVPTQGRPAVEALIRAAEATEEAGGARRRG